MNCEESVGEDGSWYFSCATRSLRNASLPSELVGDVVVAAFGSNNDEIGVGGRTVTSVPASFSEREVEGSGGAGGGGFRRLLLVDTPVRARPGRPGVPVLR